MKKRLITTVLLSLPILGASIITPLLIESNKTTSISKGNDYVIKNTSEGGVYKGAIGVDKRNMMANQETPEGIKKSITVQEVVAAIGYNKSYSKQDGEYIDNLKITCTEDDNYHGWLRVSGRGHSYDKRWPSRGGAPIVGWRDYNFELFITGYYRWHTQLKVDSFKAPDELKNESALIADLSIENYVKNHLNEYFKDLPSGINMNNVKVVSEPNPADKSISINISLPKWLDQDGMTNNFAKTFSFKITDFSKQTEITPFTVVGESIKGQLYNNDIKQWVIVDINDNLNILKEKFNIPVDSKVIDIKPVSDVSYMKGAEKGIIQFYATLNKYYNDQGQVVANGEPFVVSVSGFKIYNTELVNEKSNLYNYETSKDISVEDIKLKTLQLINEGKVFNGQFRDGKNYSSLTLNDFEIELNGVNTKTNEIPVKIILNPGIIWSNGQIANDSLDSNIIFKVKESSSFPWWLVATVIGSVVALALIISLIIVSVKKSRPQRIIKILPQHNKPALNQPKKPISLATTNSNFAAKRVGPSITLQKPVVNKQVVNKQIVKKPIRVNSNLKAPIKK